MKSARKAVSRDNIKKEWTKLWPGEGEDVNQLRAICKRPHAELESGPKLYNQVSGRNAGKIEQFDLNQYLSIDSISKATHSVHAERE
jgi:hypothetical protein